MKNTLVFATHNKNKVKEVLALANTISIKSLDEIGITEDIEETGLTIEENALIKARYVFAKSKTACFADDTGLEVEALDGAPGVYSARYAGEECNSEKNIDKLLDALSNNENRTAKFRTVIALVDANGEQLFEGIVNGCISKVRLGDGGFGYDPVFIPNGYDVSFAQMDLSDKNKISHRALAFKKFIEHINR